MSIFTICNISLRYPQNASVMFQLKIPTDHLLYHSENVYLEQKQKHAVSVHVSLNEMSCCSPPPFPE